MTSSQTVVTESSSPLDPVVFFKGMKFPATAAAQKMAASLVIS
jgi:hypothetical protein